MLCLAKANADNACKRVSLRDTLRFSMLNFFIDAGIVWLAGERSLFCLNDNGSVRFMKKFEYNPSCFIPYASGKKIILVKYGQKLGNAGMRWPPR